MQLNNKDWTGNKRAPFAALGASNHTDYDRAEYDYYATDPLAVDLICNVENFNGGIWENCCGEGICPRDFKHLAMMLSVLI